jgi:hypothetical protein
MMNPAVGAAIASMVRSRFKQPGARSDSHRAAASLPLLSYLGGNALAL